MLNYKENRSMKEIIGGCVLINDIIGSSMKTGGGRGKRINQNKSRFNNLGIPAGFCSSSTNNRAKVATDHCRVGVFPEKIHNILTGLIKSV